MKRASEVRQACGGPSLLTTAPASGWWAVWARSLLGPAPMDWSCPGHQEGGSAQVATWELSALRSGPLAFLRASPEVRVTERTSCSPAAEAKWPPVAAGPLGAGAQPCLPAAPLLREVLISLSLAHPPATPNQLPITQTSSPAAAVGTRAFPS
ncbi:hypothetical protein HJG60_011915 [Phyllostomus discolor]|uniref:Uncharacterized protein n=1 Tax=Phyllostomus discolor TaxID=89673 RepID=A0A834DSU9_9CHIR|nr:hypothetical protein HJG60_011915 [Phyllostomus discolor]